MEGGLSNSAPLRQGTAPEAVRGLAYSPRSRWVALRPEGSTRRRVVHAWERAWEAVRAQRQARERQRQQAQQRRVGVHVLYAFTQSRKRGIVRDTLQRYQNDVLQMSHR